MLIKQTYGKGFLQDHPHFMLVPSLSCPASCRYCFGPNTGPAMDAGMVNRVVNYMAAVTEGPEHGKVRVTLHGGEPLAAGYEIIRALVEGLHGRFFATGIEIGIQSNLWLLDERYCQLFSKYNVRVSTSLDGPEELNDCQRGRGCYAQTMKGIRLARSYGLWPSCVATFTSQTAPHWKSVFDFFLGEGLHFSVHPSVSAIGGSTGMELTADQYGKLCDDMFGYYLQNRKNIKIGSFDQICQGVACNDGKVCTFRDCLGMFLAIDPYGDLYSCQRLAGRKEYRLGNVKDNPSMADLGNSPAAKALLGRETEIKEKCAACVHYRYCKGGCVYNAIAANGQPNTVDPLCEAYKKIFGLVRNKLHEEMISDENIKAISKLGPSERGHPLLRAGQALELTDDHTHPYNTANTARKILAAYELAKTPNAHRAANNLARTGAFPSEALAEAALRSLRAHMMGGVRLNKIYLHITWNCQLRCTHCYASAQSPTAANEMDTGHIAATVRDAACLGFQEIVLTGGEPLLHRDIHGLLERLSGIRWEIKPARLILRTNMAMPLSPEDHMLLAGAFDEIVISVDGGKEDHDERRGAGSYHKTVANLQAYTGAVGNTVLSGAGRVRSARLSLSATMKAPQVNTGSGYAVKELGNRLNIRHVKFRPLLPLGRALDLEEPISSEAPRSYMEPLELIKEGFSPVHTCGIGQNLYVEPSGEAFPCYSFHKRHSYLGNVVAGGLKDILESEPFQALRACTVDTNYGCKKCDYRYLCGGACRAWGREAAQRDLNAAPVECDGIRKRAESLYLEALAYLGAVEGPHPLTKGE